MIIKSPQKDLIDDYSEINVLSKTAVSQQQGGALSLIECTLIEELDASDEDCEYLYTNSYRTPVSSFL